MTPHKINDYETRIKQQARKAVSNFEDRQDLEQNIRIGLLISTSQCRDASKEESYNLSTIRRLSITHATPVWNQHKREIVCDPHQLSSEGIKETNSSPSLHELTLEAMMYARKRRALEEARRREAEGYKYSLAHYSEQKTVKEVARQFGVTANRVKDKIKHFKVLAQNAYTQE